MKPAAARWLEFAQIDLRAAKSLLMEGSLAAVVCFHAQQSVEKCLKALIESKSLNPPKSHDLIMLYGHVVEMVTIEEDTLAKLNQTYIDTRYPASLGFSQMAYQIIKRLKCSTSSPSRSLYR